MRKKLVRRGNGGQVYNLWEWRKAYQRRRSPNRFCFSLLRKTFEVWNILSRSWVRRLLSLLLATILLKQLRFVGPTIIPLVMKENQKSCFFERWQKSSFGIFSSILGDLFISRKIFQKICFENWENSSFGSFSLIWTDLPLSWVVFKGI